MAEEDDTGYSYPISSKVVEKVLTDLRIQQAIEENRLAIEQLQALQTVLAFEDIWAMGFVNREWVMAKIKSTEEVLTFDEIWAMGFVNAEWVQAQIEATERVLNFDDILGMGFVTGEWVGDQGFAATSWVDYNYVSHNELLNTLLQLPDQLQTWGYLTESQIQALIGSIGVLTFDDIWGMGYRDEDWVQDTFINKDALIADFVQKTQLGVTPMELPNGDAPARTDTLNGFLTKTWRDGKTYPNDHVLHLLMEETGDLSNSKLDRNDFNDFLKTGVTPEFMDLVAGSLMDVNVHGIKMDLVEALEGRPTFGQVPSVPITLWDGGTGDIVGFLSENHDRILAIGNLSDFLKDTVLVQTLGIGGSRIKQFDTCFRGTGSGLEGLTSSLKDDIGGVRNNFSLIKDYMGNVGGAFEALRDSLADIRGRISFLGVSEETMELILQTIENFATDEKANFDAIKSEFNIAKDSLDKLSGKADQLKTCGAANLEW